MKELKVVWTSQARESLKKIYGYYKDKSEQGAKNVRDEIYKSPGSIRFAKQYQIDELNPDYRRIIVRDYKVIYKEDKGVVRIVDIQSTRQEPKKLK